MFASHSTGDRADAFIRREALCARILDIFRVYSPSDEELARIDALAQIAFSKVAEYRGLGDGELDEEFAAAHDYLECAGLYGYVLGLHQGQALVRRAATAAGD